MSMSIFGCSVVRVLVPNANYCLVAPNSQSLIYHLITLLCPRCGVNLSDRLLGMQLRYLQSLKIVIMVRLKYQTIFCNLRSLHRFFICFWMFIAYSQVANFICFWTLFAWLHSSLAMLSLFSFLSSRTLFLNHQVLIHLILARNN